MLNITAIQRHQLKPRQYTWSWTGTRGTPLGTEWKLPIKLPLSLPVPALRAGPVAATVLTMIGTPANSIKPRKTQDGHFIS